MMLRIIVPMALAVSITFHGIASARTDGKSAKLKIDTTIQVSLRDPGPTFLFHHTVFSCDTADLCFIVNEQVLNNENRSVMQEWSDTISAEYGVCSYPDTPTFLDINFDGYKDICFESWCTEIMEWSHLGYFRQYNPKTMIFERASQFDSLDGSISIGEGQTIEEHISMGGGDAYWLEKIYKYVDGKLVLIKTQEIKPDGWN